jgi:hypothetical protein
LRPRNNDPQKSDRKFHLGLITICDYVMIQVMTWPSCSASISARPGFTLSKCMRMGITHAK